jgi:hypothetical protein
MAPKHDHDMYLDPLERSWWFIINWVVPGFIFFALVVLGFHFYCSAIAGNHFF